MTYGTIRKWVVFDDDPTGTQTVSGVDVILRPTRESFRRFVGGSSGAVYVLTNTRAMPQDEAIQLLMELKRDMDREAEAAGCRIGYLLRGDSTLRGHVFAEMEAMSEGGEAYLFVPAFPECGRVTRNGVHYLIQGEKWTPVADTEFARDSVFGYESRTMADWVKEKGEGWTAITIPLPELRAHGPSTVQEALLQAGPRSVVIPDAETREDLTAIADGLAGAEEAGRNVVVRSASTFAAIRCGLEARQLSAPPGDEPARLLVVCGSHTAASTRQLEALERSVGARPVVLPSERIFAEGPDAVVPELAVMLRDRLMSDNIAVLATERHRDSALHGGLADGALMMRALTETVKAVANQCDAVVSKGGITSALVAADGLQADEAEVCGQLESGISLWHLRRPGEKRMWYAVVPGNVGDERTLLRIVALMKPSVL